MGYRYTTEDRILGGSMEDRLSPRIAQTGLNQKIGGNMPQPLVHCNDKAVPDQQGGRRARVGLPKKLEGY
jgi:hypothetical protein